MTEQDVNNFNAHYKEIMDFAGEYFFERKKIEAELENKPNYYQTKPDLSFAGENWGNLDFIWQVTDGNLSVISIPLEYFHLPNWKELLKSRMTKLREERLQWEAKNKIEMEKEAYLREKATYERLKAKFE